MPTGGVFFFLSSAMMKLRNTPRNGEPWSRGGVAKCGCLFGANSANTSTFPFRFQLLSSLCPLVYTIRIRVK